MEDFKNLPDDIKALFIEKDTKGNFRLTMFGTLALLTAILSLLWHNKTKI